MEKVNHQFWIDKIRADLGLKKDPNRKQGCPDLRYSDRFQRAAKRMMEVRRMGGVV